MKNQNWQSRIIYWRRNFTKIKKVYILDLHDSRRGETREINNISDEEMLSSSSLVIIIGANTVVTKNVEPHSIVGGVPAKLIRKRFSQMKLMITLLQNF